MAVRYSFGLGFGGRRLARRGRGWRRSRGCRGGRIRVGFTDEVYGALVYRREWCVAYVCCF